MFRKLSFIFALIVLSAPALAGGPTPSSYGTAINTSPWVNGRALMTGPKFQNLFNTSQQILNGMGTWDANGNYTPNGLSANVTGLRKSTGPGTSDTAAVPGLDYIAPGIGSLLRSQLPFGQPAWTASAPDTVEFYPAITTVANSANVLLVGANMQTSDAGKWIRITGGSRGSNANYYNGKIVSVQDATHITVSAPYPTLAMEAVSSLRVTYGSDQTANIQASYTMGAALNVDAVLQGGFGPYMVSSGSATMPALVCLPAANKNGQNAPGSMCPMSMGVTLMAMTPMSAVIQDGSTDFSAPIRNGTLGGGTIDCNFLANYGDDLPLTIVGTLKDRVAKNCLLGGVREGLKSSDPGFTGVGGGVLLSNWQYNRDSFLVNVVGVTNSATPTVTTQWDHGLATGDSITLENMAPCGMPGFDNRFYEVTVTGPRSFQLRNTSTVSAGTFTCTGPPPNVAFVARNMPSMHVPHFVAAITNANPAVVTFNDTIYWTNGQQIWLADMQGSKLGGQYTACAVAAQTVSLHVANDNTCTGATVDTSQKNPDGVTYVLGTFTGNGSAEAYDDPLTVEKGVYLANAPDADGANLQIKGVRWGIYADPTTSGYDGKWVRLHIYNFGEDGQLFAGMSLGGNEVITNPQVDIPFRYAYRFTAGGNTALGAQVNYTGNEPLPNYASTFRMETGASVNVFGGSAKGTAAAPMFATVSGSGFAYGVTPGFKSLGFDDTQYVSITQPDRSTKPDFRVISNTGPASLTVQGGGTTASSAVSFCDPATTAGDVNNLGITHDTNNVYFNFFGPSCAFITTAMRMYRNGTSYQFYIPVNTTLGTNYASVHQILGTASIAGQFGTISFNSGQINSTGGDPTLYLNYASTGGVDIASGGGTTTVHGAVKAAALGTSCSGQPTGTLIRATTPSGGPYALSSCP